MSIVYLISTNNTAGKSRLHKSQVILIHIMKFTDIIVANWQLPILF